jgi:hypothetical protein
MAALREFKLSENRFVGTVPASWGRWKNVKLVGLHSNRRLTGCLPSTWRPPNLSADEKMYARLSGARALTVYYGGTKISGYC